MAYVDLNSQDAERIRNQYRQSLGRDASNDEVSGWLSGSYGGGSVDDRLNQISNSGEAQNYRGNQTPVLNQQPETSHGYDQPAGVDQSFSSGLNNFYQQYLGRGASPDEIGNWWSGAYGYGSGAGGLNQFGEAIRNSAEAKGRNNGQAPNPTYQTTDYWNTQGVKDADIFNLQTGQLNPGWARTAQGYSRTGGATPNVSGPQGGNFQQWFQSLIQGKPATPQTLRELAPILNQYGIKLGPNNARGFTDGIILPDGTFIDTIIGATENGGQGWGWMQPSGGVGGGPAPGNQYSDPYTQFLEQLIKSRIGSLQGGYDDAARRQYEAALQQRSQSLATGNAQLTQLMDYLQSRFTDLKGPGYTGAENEVLRTAALDPIERDRTAARKRMTERLAAMGHTPESGVFQQVLAELDKEFDGMRAIQQTQLATNELGRRENRNQRAEAIASQIADIPELRAREQLDVFQALNNLSSLARNEDEARSREAISYGGVLAGMGPERLQLAMQAAGMGGNPSALGGVLSNIMGINQQYGMQNQANSDSWLNALGSLSAIIQRSGQSGLSGAGR